MTVAYMSSLRNSFRRKKRRSAVELEICPVGTEIYQSQVLPSFPQLQCFMIWREIISYGDIVESESEIVEFIVVRIYISQDDVLVNIYDEIFYRTMDTLSCFVLRNKRNTPRAYITSNDDIALICLYGVYILDTLYITYL